MAPDEVHQCEEFWGKFRKLHYKPIAWILPSPSLIIFRHMLSTLYRSNQSYIRLHWRPFPSKETMAQQAGIAGREGREGQGAGRSARSEYTIHYVQSKYTSRSSGGVYWIITGLSLMNYIIYFINVQYLCGKCLKPVTIQFCKVVAELNLVLYHRSESLIIIASYIGHCWPI